MNWFAVRTCCTCLSLATCLAGQWQPPQRLTCTDAVSTTFLNQAWCVAADGDTVHVVWDEYREGCPEVYVCCSFDAGITWTNGSRVSDSTADSESGHLAVWKDAVHVVWCDEQQGTGEIYYCRSTDAGLTWGPAERLTVDAGMSTSPSVAVNDSTVHLVWSDDRAGHSEIFYKRSTDCGVSWDADRQLSTGSVAALFPSISAAEARVHVVWAAGWEIFHVRSLDSGLTWEKTDRLTYDPAVSWFPSVAVSDTIVHVVWHDQRDGYMDVFYKRSIDGGATWLNDSNLTANSANSNIPCLAAADSMVHIAWYDSRDGNYEIYYKRSRDHGMTWEPDSRLTQDSAASKAPCCAISGARVHVVWTDFRDGNFEIYYTQNPTGNAVEEKIIAPMILHQCTVQTVPNPFRTVTRIGIETGQNPESLNVKIYDASGRLIKFFYPMPHALSNSLIWDGSDDSGRSLPPGVYFVRVYAGGFTETLSAVLLR